jgi:hypothetical protein
MAVIKLRAVAPYSSALKIASAWDRICVSHGWSGCHDYGFRGQAIRLITPKADISSLWCLDIKGNEWLRFHFTFSNFVRRHVVTVLSLRISFEICIGIEDSGVRRTVEMKVYSNIVLHHCLVRRNVISSVYILCSVSGNLARPGRDADHSPPSRAEVEND